jgi:hypothetical protein
MEPRLFTALLAALVFSGPALAQTDDLLGFVPDDALGCILLRHIGQADEQATQLAKWMNAPLPESVLGSFKKFFRIDKSLDTTGAGLTVAFLNAPNENDPVRAVLVVPVTDYPQFLQETGAVKGDKGISEFKPPNGKNMVVANEGKFAVLAEKDHQADLEKVLAAKKGGAGAFKGLDKELAKNDVSVVMTRKGIQDYAKIMNEALAIAKNPTGKPTKSEEKLSQQYFESLGQFVKAADKSVTRVVLGVRFNEKDNLHLTFLAPFLKGSVFAKAAAGYKSPPGGLLANLPGGSLVGAYGLVVPKTMRAALTNLVKEGLANSPGIPPGQGPEMIAAVEAMMAFDSMAIALYPRAKDAPILGAHVVSVIRAPNAQTYLANNEKATKALAKIQPEASGVTSTVRRVKVGDLEGLEYTSRQVAKDPIQKFVQKILLGPKGTVTSSMVAVDEHTIVSAYVPAEQLAKVLERMKEKTGQLSEQAESKQFIAKVPAGSQYLFLMSPHRTAAFAAQLLAEQFPNAPKLPQFPKTPMAGFGIYVTPEGARGDLIVPHAVLELAPAYFEKLKQLLPPGPGA